MGDISDTFMTLAAIAPLADASIGIEGIGHARPKESDHVAAVMWRLFSNHELPSYTGRLAEELR
ncbi:hypothetical protein [Streptomyces sp. NPDC058307]|uniref:hypothetical protein n=1 Tax=Streptomyces sp. NPDC058307 TaxID=3346439 RepID=UPI0036F01188